MPSVLQWYTADGSGLEDALLVPHYAFAAKGFVAKVHTFGPHRILFVGALPRGYCVPPMYLLAELQTKHAQLFTTKTFVRGLAVNTDNIAIPQD